MVAVQAQQTLGREDAPRGFGQGLDAVRMTLPELMLQADEIAREQKIEDLAPAITEYAITERPARHQGEAFLAGIAFAKRREPAPTRVWRFRIRWMKSIAASVLAENAPVSRNGYCLQDIGASMSLWSRNLAGLQDYRSIPSWRLCWPFVLFPRPVTDDRTLPVVVSQPTRRRRVSRLRRRDRRRHASGTRGTASAVNRCSMAGASARTSRGRARRWAS